MCKNYVNMKQCKGQKFNVIANRKLFVEDTCFTRSLGKKSVLKFTEFSI